MLTACLKNAISGEVVRVSSAKGRTPDGKVVDVWIDCQRKPVCVIGNELPSWRPTILNNHFVADRDAEGPRYPIGTISR